ncbi:MAG: hypothetical protein IJI24_06165, partial [Lachnospiraceae bacterium]|nr:hypothetical protein [Lachnospiraceae bacterium]
SLTRNGKEARKNRPVAAVTYFVPCSDSENFAYGSQGRYETVTGMVTKVDTVITQTITVDQQVLPLDLVTDISVPSAGLPGAEHGSLAFREEI